MSSNKYFKINEISKLYNISTDSIRYYEKVGVLKPKRDAVNNYRLYSKDDIRKITMIRELLNLNFSLEQIKEFDEHRTVHNSMDLLKKELTVVNDTLVKLFLAKESIESRLSAFQAALSISPNKQIRILDLFERPCTLISHKDIPDSNMDYATIKYMKIHDLKIDTIGACDCYTLSLDEVSDDPEYYKTKNVFFYSKNNTYNCNYVLPAGKYLSVTYTGPYSQTKQIIPKMLQYAKEHNYKIVSDPIEFCHIDEYETANVNEYVTELQIRVE